MDLKSALKTSEKELNKHINAEIAAKKEAIAKKVEEELKDVSLIDTGDGTSTEEILPQELELQDNCGGFMDSNCIHSGPDINGCDSFLCDVIHGNMSEGTTMGIFIGSGVIIRLILSLFITMIAYVIGLFKKSEHPLRYAFKKTWFYHFLMLVIIALMFFLFYYALTELKVGTIFN